MARYSPTCPLCPRRRCAHCPCQPSLMADIPECATKRRVRQCGSPPGRDVDHPLASIIPTHHITVTLTIILVSIWSRRALSERHVADWEQEGEVVREGRWRCRPENEIAHDTTADRSDLGQYSNHEIVAWRTSVAVIALHQDAVGSGNPDGGLRRSRRLPLARLTPR